MPITIRDSQFDHQMAEEARYRGGISKTAAIMSLAAERLEQLRMERKARALAAAKLNEPSQSAAPTGG